MNSGASTSDPLASSPRVRTRTFEQRARQARGDVEASARHAVLDARRRDRHHGLLRLPLVGDDVGNALREPRSRGRRGGGREAEGDEGPVPPRGRRRHHRGPAAAASASCASSSPAAGCRAAAASASRASTRCASARPSSSSASSTGARSRASSPAPSTRSRAVQSSRVHLVLAGALGLRGRAEPASASVVLKLRAGRALGGARGGGHRPPRLVVGRGPHARIASRS